MGTTPRVVRIGTRASTLAMTQSSLVAQAIRERSGLDVELVTIKTQGDVSTEPLSQLGGTGVFVSALRAALLAGQCDLAVHSLKDLPTGQTEGIALAAVPERADARDVLCARDGLRVDTLPSGARIGTGSPRRRAQLLAARADLDVLDIRGNVDTRLRRVGADLDAVVLAAAGLDRLGRGEVITERFALDRVPTAPGQGALAIERRVDVGDDRLSEALRMLDHMPSRQAILAERALLRRLDAGCAAPVGASAHLDGSALTLAATVYSPDGARSLRATRATVVREADAAENLGLLVAEELLAQGAASLADFGSAR